MASTTSVLEDVSSFLARLPVTYARLGTTPWRIGSLLRGGRRPGVGALPFLLISSFIFTLVWDYWGVWGFDTARLMTKLRASAKSGFNVLDLLLACAPIFFAAVVTTLVASRAIAFLFATPGSRAQVTEEVREVTWFATGFQILTVSLWIAIPEIVFLAKQGLAGWTHFNPPRPPNPWRMQALFPVLALYLSILPFLLAAGYVRHRYRFPRPRPVGFRKWLKPVSALLAIGWGALFATGMSVATLSTVQEIAEQNQPTIKSPVVSQQEPLPGGDFTRVVSRPDSSQEFHLSMILHNGSDRPVLLGRSIGRLSSEDTAARDLAPAILDPFEETIPGFIVVPPNAVRQLPITITCTQDCLGRMRRSRRSPHLEISYRSPTPNGPWHRLSGPMLIVWGDGVRQELFADSTH